MRRSAIKETCTSYCPFIIVIKNCNVDEPIIAGYHPNSTSLYSYEENADINIGHYVSPLRDRTEKMDIDKVKEFITKRFKQLSGITAVYLCQYDDHIEINTVLNTKHRATRSKLFKNQLKIHEAFPNLMFDFRVLFSNKAISKKDLDFNTGE